jgi:hypothetical protein
MDPENKLVTIYLAEGYLHSMYDYEENVFIIKIHDFNLGEHRQKAFPKNVEVMRKNKPKSVIMDCGGARGSHSPSDSEWITKTAFPEYSKIGIKFVYYIFPQNFIGKLGARSWITIAEDFGFDFIYVPSIAHAYKLIVSRKQES